MSVNKLSNTAEEGYLCDRIITLKIFKLYLVVQLVIIAVKVGEETYQNWWHGHMHLYRATDRRDVMNMYIHGLVFVNFCLPTQHGLTSCID